MANAKTRLKPSVLRDNIKSHDAINALADYAPSNGDFTKAKINAARQLMESDQAEETTAYGIWQAKRDKAAASEHAHNDIIRGGRTQVKAQYGENSDEVQKVGLKKKNEYKSPTRKPKTEK